MAQQAKIAEFSGTEVISLAEAKTYLRIDFDSDDTYITDLIKIARMQVLKDTNVPVVTTTITEYFRDWPAYNIFYLQYAGTMDNTVLKYYNPKGIETTLTLDTDYRIINYCGTNTVEMINNNFNLEDRRNAITFKYEVSPDNDDTARTLKIAMFMLIQHFYDNRSPVSYLKVDEMPLAYKHIIQQFKNYTW